MNKLRNAATAALFALCSAGAASAADWVSAPSGVKATDRVPVNGEVAGASEVMVIFISPTGAKDKRLTPVVNGKFSLDYIPGMTGQHQVIVKSGTQVKARFLIGV